MKRLALILCLTMSAVPASFAAGFALYEGGSRGNALGGLTGAADDASAIYYNAAGMTQLEGRHVMGGVTLIAPMGDIDIVNAYDGSSQTGTYADNVFTPPHMYYTHQLNDNLWVGGGIYSRFGLGSEFDDPTQFYGRYSNTDTLIQSVSASVHLAYKVNENLSLAVGLVYNWLDAELNQAIDTNQFFLQPWNDPTTTQLDAYQNLVGDSVEYGYNLALHYTPGDKWRFGLMYNSEVEHVVDGLATFTRPNGIPDTFFVDTTAETDPITLPDMLFIGVDYKATEKLHVAFSAVKTGWSSIQSLGFNYDQPIVVIPGLLELDYAAKHLAWEDVWRYAIGFDHKISEKTQFMWGFTLDESPVPDETISFLLPTNDRQVLNLGFSHMMENGWRVEASYMYLTMSDRDIEQRQLAEGVLQARVDGVVAHLLGFTATKRF